MGSVQLGPANVPPTVASTSYLGLEHDSIFNSNLYHDCGSGTAVNGYYLQTFCDSYTTIGQENGTLQSFTHNTMAYLGYRDPSDVTSIYQLGGYPNKAPGENFFNVGQGAVALQANETNLSLWPWGGLATLPDNKTAVGVYNVNTPSGNESFYTTLVSITAQEPTDTTDGIGYNMPTQRLVKQHFYPNEILYGYFALTVAHPDDSYLYLWGKVSNGLKLARAPLASIADRTTYKYWSAASKAWADQPPAADDATANAIPFNHTTFAPLSPSSGNVFWSPHHRTYLAVIMDSSVAGTFWVAYSTTGAITGPWTETAQLYQTPQDPACKQDGLRDTWNYSGFPHPGLDPSGASLVVSWSACGPFVDMSRLVWK